MVSAGQVNSVSSELSSYFSEYKSSISDLDGVWKGDSHDNLVAKANEFAGDYEGKIANQLSSFADAISAYEAYKQAKQQYKIASTNYNNAYYAKDSAAMNTYQSQMSQHQRTMNTQKSKITSLLQQVSSVKLDSGSSAASALSASNSSNDNLTSYSGNSSSGGSAGGLSSPLGSYRVTSEFGYRGNIGVPGATADHKGIDLGGNPTGTPIYAAKGGTVTAAQWMNGYGNVVFIDHGDGMQTRYAHCSALDVQPGQYVDSGQAIAKIGSTGNSSGPHLHFEVRIDGTAVNPREYFSF